MDWKEEKYDQTFEETELFLERRRQTEDFGIADLEALLHYQYVHQGHDWDGRGAIFEIQKKATIDAYEHVLRRWKREEAQGRIAAEAGHKNDGNNA